MDANKYHELALRTMNGDLEPRAYIQNAALGLAGEAGEVADHIKKHCFQGHPLDQAKLAEELGDLLWYVALMSAQIGFSMSAIMEMNIKKLRARYPEGFSEERSRNRVPAEPVGRDKLDGRDGAMYGGHP